MQVTNNDKLNGRLMLFLPADLIKQIRIHCVEIGSSPSRLIRPLIEEELKKAGAR
jgi:hypothetical protein